jgi:hypothetical protein
MTLEDKVQAMISKAGDAKWDEARPDYRIMKLKDRDTPEHKRGIFNCPIEPGEGTWGLLTESDSR